MIDYTAYAIFGLATATAVWAAWKTIRHTHISDAMFYAIAAVLGITANAVAIRLHRARARYADALARTRDDDDLKYLGPTRTSADVKGTNGAEWKGVVE